MSLEIIKDETKKLFVYIENSLGEPAIGLELSDITMRFFFAGGTSSSINPDTEHGYGVYSYDFTDSLNQDFEVVIYALSGAEDIWTEGERVNIIDDPWENITVGDYGLYGRIQINGVDSDGVTVRVFTSTGGYVRETSSAETLQTYPEDASKYYNWVVKLESAGTYIISFYKAGYISANWTIVISETTSYFEDLILA